LRRGGLPVFSVGVGSAVRPKEVRIRQVRTDEFVYLNDEITLSALVTGEGYAGQARDVLLYEDGRLVQKAEVTLGERPTEVVFRHAPKQAGEHVYQIRVGAEEGLGTEANLREVRVRVLDQKIRVLCVEGTPRFEFKLLREALAEDPVIDYTSLLRITSAYYMQGAPYLKNPAAGFPRSEEELLHYDVVILGSLSRAALAVRFPRPTRREVRLVLAPEGGPVATPEPLPPEGAECRKRIEPSERSFRYWFLLGGKPTEAHTITVTERPCRTASPSLKAVFAQVLKGVDITYGERAAIWVEAEDNCQPTPNVGKSTPFHPQAASHKPQATSSACLSWARGLELEAWSLRQ
jgi:hypothetical protein